MSDTQTVILVGVLGDLVLLAIFVWLPVMNKERAFFGVRVEHALYRGDGRRTLHRYWLTLAGIFLFCDALGFFLMGKFDKPLLAVLMMVVPTGAAFVIYSIYAREVHPHAVPNLATRFASPIQARSLRDYTYWWLEVAVAGLTIGAFAISVYYYPQIPARMPVHWNASGTADGWAQKSLAALFFLPAVGLYMQNFFIILKHDLAHARITLPGEHSAEFLSVKERYLMANIRLMDWARISVAVLFSVISLLIITTVVHALSRFTSLISVGIWVTVAVMVGSIAYYIWQMKQVNDELREKFGESYVQRSADETHWRQGGLSYYNPDDPALVVEKLVGFGYTLNLAHPGIRSRLALLVGVPLFIVWALLSF